MFQSCLLSRRLWRALTGGFFALTVQTSMAVSWYETGPAHLNPNLATEDFAPLHLSPTDLLLSPSGAPAPTGGLAVTATLLHSTCNPGNDGSITLNVSGGSGTYTYQWSNGGSTAQLTGLNAGTYSVTVSDGSGTNVVQTHELGFQVGYFETSGMTVAGQSITKQAADGLANGQALTTNNLGPNQNGALIYQYNTGSSTQVIAFRHSEERIGYNLKNQDYALWLANDNVSILIDGQLVVSGAAPQNGEVFRLSREGNAILFSRNGRVFHQTTTDAAHYLNGEVRLYSNGDQLNGLAANFCYGPLSLEASIYDASSTEGGKVELLELGGQPPYTLAWDDQTGLALDTLDSIFSDTNLFPLPPTNLALGGSLNPRSQLRTGSYSVSVQDASQATFSKTIEVGTEIIWHNVIGGQFDGYRSFSKTASDGWGNALFAAANRFDAGEQANMSFEVPSNKEVMALGLRNATLAQAQVVSDFDFAFSIDQSALHIQENGQLLSNVSTVAQGDHLELRQDGTVLEYLKNGTPIRTTTLPGATDFTFQGTVYKTNGKVNGFSSRSDHWPTVDATIVHANCITNLGSISVTLDPVSGTSNYNYQWFMNGELIGNTLTPPSPLGSGTYELEISYIDPSGNQQVVSSFHSIGYEVVWTDLVNATATTNTLTSTNTQLGQFGGGASMALLPANLNGWAEYEVGNFITDPSGDHYHAAFGFSYSNTDHTFTHINYVIELVKTPTNSFAIFRTSSSQNQVASLDFNPGDRVRISRTGGGQILLQLRPLVGSLVDIVPAQPFVSNYNAALLVDVSILGNSYSIENTITSFGCPTGLTAVDVPYAHLERKLDGSTIHTIGKQLGFRFWEEYSVTEVPLEYRIIDPISNNEVYNNADGSAAPQELVSYGTQNITFNFCDFPLPSGIYVLEVTNSKRERWYLRFYHNDGVACN